MVKVDKQPRVYHHDCYKCCYNDHLIDINQPVIFKDNLICCEQHKDLVQWATGFICQNCNKEIKLKEKYLEIDQKYWHLNCFKCHDCKKIIQPGSIKKIEQYYVCIDCYDIHSFKQANQQQQKEEEEEGIEPEEEENKDVKQPAVQKEQEFYSYDQLRNKDSLPNNVEFNNRHLYLTNDEFLKLFKMDKDSFQKLAQWQQKGNVKN